MILILFVLTLERIRIFPGPRPESSKDRKEAAKRAKATRLAAAHVASESGIPADRGSFTVSFGA